MTSSNKGKIFEKNAEKLFHFTKAIHSSSIQSEKKDKLARSSRFVPILAWSSSWSLIQVEIKSDLHLCGEQGAFHKYQQALQGRMCCRHVDGKAVVM